MGDLHVFSFLAAHNRKVCILKAESVYCYSDSVLYFNKNINLLEGSQYISFKKANTMEVSARPVTTNSARKRQQNTNNWKRNVAKKLRLVKKYDLITLIKLIITFLNTIMIFKLIYGC